MSRPAAGWDAIVVGAGPAGSATAARLAMGGHRTVLLDREEFPRRKPCGDCLSPAAVRALESLGVGDQLRSEPRAVLAGWRIRPESGLGFEGRFPGADRGVAIARERLDHLLLEHARAAGAVARTGVKVTGLLRDGHGVAGVRATADGRPVEMRGRLVVGADGLRSVVLRRLHLLRRLPRLWKIALTARLRGVSAPDAGELHAFSWGCVGIAGIGDGRVNATVVLYEGAVRQAAGARDACFDEVVSGIASLRGAVRDGEVLATGPFDWPVRSAVADGAILVGDAAGYYDPFTGQGVYRALRGAELAAEVVAPALARGDVSARGLRGYDRARRREFGPGERFQRVIEAFVSRPGALAAAAAAIRARPGFADALVAVTGDVAPIRTLLNPRRLLWARG